MSCPTSLHNYVSNENQIHKTKKEAVSIKTEHRFVVCRERSLHPSRESCGIPADVYESLILEGLPRPFPAPFLYGNQQVCFLFVSLDFQLPSRCQHGHHTSPSQQHRELLQKEGKPSSCTPGSHQRDPCPRGDSARKPLLLAFSILTASPSCEGCRRSWPSDSS